MLDTLLKQQGLTNREISALTMLMEMGEQPASTIARKLGINRSSCYLILDKLSRQGLVSQINKQGTAYFLAIDADLILDQIKLKHLQEVRNINSFKHTLKLSRQEAKNEVRSKAHYFTGQDGIESLLQQIIKLNSSSARIFLTNTLTPHPSELLIANYIRENKFTNLRIIGTAKSKVIPAQKTLPMLIDLGINLIILDQQIAIISLEENFALLIESPHICSGQSKIFDFYWKMSH